jgi:hypothetical protein
MKILLLGAISPPLGSIGRMNRKEPYSEYHQKPEASIK